MSITKIAPWAVLALVVVVLAVVAGRGASDGGPYDPRGTGPQGARAVVLLLEELGAEVELGAAVPPAGTDVALVLVDRLDDDTAAGLDAWVRDGGTLVVADPFSRFAPFFQPLPAPGDVRDRGTCDVAALQSVQELLVDASEFGYPVPEVARSCFGDGRLAFVVVVPRGAGVVAALGSPEPFVNRQLAQADHAALAAALLAPEPGVRVAIVERLVGTGERGLLDLVGDNVWLMVVQLGVAFVVLALWQGRRLGRPVEEHQPVPIAGSELTEAVARLLERAQAPDRAAALLRRAAHRRVADTLGAPTGTPTGPLASMVADRTGLDAGDVEAALAGTPVGTDDDLVELAVSIERIEAALGATRGGRRGETAAEAVTNEVMRT